MSDVLIWTSLALYSGFVLAYGWVFAGVPHSAVEVVFCTVAHLIFLMVAIKAMRIRWEEKE